MIYAALKHELYTREPCIVSCLHPPLLSILSILEGDPKKPMESRPVRVLLYVITMFLELSILKYLVLEM